MDGKKTIIYNMHIILAETVLSDDEGMIGANK